MSCFSDPTANRAIGAIDREIARREKRAKEKFQLYREGKLPEKRWREFKSQYTGIFAGCLIRAEKAVLDEESRKDNETA